MLRFGLCCMFRAQPIRFRRATATVLCRLGSRERQVRLADLCRNNALALERAIRWCADHDIGAFRINSQILPLKTHPDTRYDVRDLPDGPAIVTQFEQCGAVAARLDVRLSFHPDPFVLLNSPRADVVRKSVEELEYQAEVAEWTGADVITLHGGGAYGEPGPALDRLARMIPRLSARIRKRLAMENDDRVFSPTDLLPVCRKTGTPLVYDVHHHRCHPDRLGIAEATAAAVDTWDREPLFHISSPIIRPAANGPWPLPHHDYIDPRDFPREWLGLDITVEVEAKAKELAVQRLLQHVRFAARGRASSRERCVPGGGAPTPRRNRGGK